MRSAHSSLVAHRHWPIAVSATAAIMILVGCGGMQKAWVVASAKRDRVRTSLGVGALPVSDPHALGQVTYERWVGFHGGAGVSTEARRLYAFGELGAGNEHFFAVRVGAGESWWNQQSVAEHLAVVVGFDAINVLFCGDPDPAILTNRSYQDGGIYYRMVRSNGAYIHEAGFMLSFSFSLKHIANPGTPQLPGHHGLRQ